MKTLSFLLRKEFRQIFRNRPILMMVLSMPLIQLLVMPLAADYEVKNINLAIVDADHSTYSRRLINDITASGYFRIAAYAPTFKAAYTSVAEDKADLVLEIPPHFERSLVREGEQQLFIAVNAINGAKATLGANYLTRIIADFNDEIRLSLRNNAGAGQVAIVTGNWYNPYLNYQWFMVPGILATLLTMVGGFLAALNIVKEKELGTIEQINVTPIRKHHFILGKLIPFWLLGNLVFVLGMALAWLVYGIVPVGSIAVLWLFVSIFLAAVNGFGLLVSTYSDTQQQAMFVMFFFMMLFILLGGLFTATDSMPAWARFIVKLNPVSYLIVVMRAIILKGSDLRNLLTPLLALSGFAVGLNTWAVFNYSKTNT